MNEMGSLKNHSGDMRLLVAETVARFLNEHMVLQPKSVTVDIHDRHVLVTLRQISTIAERKCAVDPTSRELLERLTSATFDVVKSALEVEIAGVLDCPVQSSRLNVDPLAGNAVLFFVLEGLGVPEVSGHGMTSTGVTP